MNQSTFSDTADALKLDFSGEVNGNKYSLQLKKKRYIILPDSLGNDSHDFFFFFFNRLIMEEKVAEELNTVFKSWSKYAISHQEHLTKHNQN